MTANNTKVRSEDIFISLLGHTVMPHYGELKEIFRHEHQRTNGTEHTHASVAIVLRLQFVGKEVKVGPEKWMNKPTSSMPPSLVPGL
jgi:hypothetical protein